MFDFGESRRLHEQFQVRKLLLEEDQYTLRASRLREKRGTEVPTGGVNGSATQATSGLSWVISRVTGGGETSSPSERLAAEKEKMRQLFNETNPRIIVRSTTSPIILRNKGITIETLFMINEYQILKLLSYGYRLPLLVALGAQWNHLLSMGLDGYVLAKYRSAFPVDLMITCYGAKFEEIFVDLCFSSWETFGAIHFSVDELKLMGCSLPVMLKTISHSDEYHGPLLADHMIHFGLSCDDWIALGFDKDTAIALGFTEKHAIQLKWPLEPSADI